MPNRIQHLHRKLQLSELTEVRAPSEQDLQVSVYERMHCFMVSHFHILFQAFFVLSSMLTPFWLWSTPFFKVHKSFALEFFSCWGLIAVVGLCSFALNQLFSYCFHKKLFCQFRRRWIRPLQGDDCVRALELIEVLREHGAARYQASVLAQHRPFYGFDLALLQHANQRQEEEQARRIKMALKTRQQQACKTLHAI